MAPKKTTGDGGATSRDGPTPGVETIKDTYIPIFNNSPGGLQGVEIPDQLVPEETGLARKIEGGCHQLADILVRGVMEASGDLRRGQGRL